MQVYHLLIIRKMTAIGKYCIIGQDALVLVYKKI